MKDNEKLKSNLVVRLNRIEGQLKGIRKMIENENHCDEVLNQIASVRGALNGVSKIILENHLKKCVVSGIKAGVEEEVINSLIVTLDKMLK